LGIRERLENIKKNISMRQLIDYFQIQASSGDIITQIKCPFHGSDIHASARIYETNSMYCFTCSKSWDVISFIQDYKKVNFGEACVFLESTFNVTRTNFDSYKIETFSFLEPQKKEIDFEKDLEKIQLLLINNMDYFELDKYIKCFYFFDSLYYNYMSKQYSNDRDFKIALDIFHKEVIYAGTSIRSRGSVFA